MRMGKPANEHYCHQNNSGIAKAIKACLSEELFRKGDYSVMIIDEDASSESKVKRNVNYDIEKWSDKNHIVVIFRKMLISREAKANKEQRCTKQIESILSGNSATCFWRS